MRNSDFLSVAANLKHKTPLLTCYCKCISCQIQRDTTLLHCIWVCACATGQRRENPDSNGSFFFSFPTCLKPSSFTFTHSFIFHNSPASHTSMEMVQERPKAKKKKPLEGEIHVRGVRRFDHERCEEEDWGERVSRTKVFGGMKLLFGCV